MSIPMTPERLAEIEARHEMSNARNIASGHAPVDAIFVERAELLAEVKRLRAMPSNSAHTGLAGALRSAVNAAKKVLDRVPSNRDEEPASSIAALVLAASRTAQA